MTLTTGVRFAATLTSALSTGVLFGTKVSLGPSTKDFAYPTYVDVQQATVRNLRPVMGTLLPGAVATNLAALALTGRHRPQPTAGLTLVGLCSQLTALVLTAAIELPINSRVLTWSRTSAPDGWEAERDRWDRVHTLRTASAVVGLGCLVAASLTRANRDGDQVSRC